MVLVSPLRYVQADSNTQHEGRDKPADKQEVLRSQGQVDRQSSETIWHERGHNLAAVPPIDAKAAINGPVSRNICCFTRHTP